eukprot:1289835-Pleurochrysis_carterae.AAC.3
MTCDLPQCIYARAQPRTSESAVHTLRRHSLTSAERARLLDGIPRNPAFVTLRPQAVQIAIFAELGTAGPHQHGNFRCSSSDSDLAK